MAIIYSEQAMQTKYLVQKRQSKPNVTCLGGVNIHSLFSLQLVLNRSLFLVQNNNISEFLELDVAPTLTKLIIFCPNME